MPVPRLCAAVLLLATINTGSVAAQECVGLPAHARGTFTVGLEGTDGAVGEGLKFSRQEPSWSVQLRYKGMGRFIVPGRMATFAIHGTHRLPKTLRDFCLTVAPEVTQYSVLYEGYSSPAILNGQYRRVGLPVGISLGHEFTVLRRFSVVAFYNPQMIAEFEHFQPDTAVLQRRSTLSYQGEAGVTLAWSWIAVRSAVATNGAPAKRLGLAENTAPTLSVQLGVLY